VSQPKTRFISQWTVDYQDERAPKAITVPHAWKQDLPVNEEGPVTYRTEILVPNEPVKLRLHGVSYQAEVSINGAPVVTHQGIWDAFDVPLEPYRSQRVQVAVRVTKNGGPTFPVKEVASGFLPFVYHTFGGIHSEVEIVDAQEPLDPPAKPSRVTTDEHRIYVDGQPLYLRGLLHWGWYPQIGHTNAPEDVIRREVRQARALGFNLVKFCLWVPPHRYLDILREEGMEAWLELPLWDPTSDPAKLEAIGQEMERIVRQYRRHDNIIVWTVGCELSESTPPEYRRDLVRMVQNLTGCPLVKDNSGGAEMYGGDLREFGTFYDFHPYCDTPYYPAVLDTLLPGPRERMPILLGEYNDIDVHRDLARLDQHLPYWMSNLPELNDQGVRWQHDLPNLVPNNRFAQHPLVSRHKELMESSRRKALFIRKTVHEAVRAREGISGYVVTGWRDTPISSSGFFDDWDAARFTSEETRPWNTEDCAFLIPTRRPPFVKGGNQPGCLDSLNFFAGQLFWKVGIASEKGLRGGLIWKLSEQGGTVVARGTGDLMEVAPFKPVEVGQIHYEAKPGEYFLEVEFAGVRNSWSIWVVERPDWKNRQGWTVQDKRGLLGIETAGGDRTVSVGSVPDAGIGILVDEGTEVMPFWREATYEFDPSFPLAERWERLLAVSPDRSLDPAQLPEGYQTLVNRIDTRTYVESPILVRAGDRLITTLRPFGGLGTQPTSLRANPVGSALLSWMMDQLES
jgi:hypothetical protein